VANHEWCEEHQIAEVWVLTARTLDHKPLCLRMGMGEGEREQIVFSKKFKVEASWMVDEEYKTVVAKAWLNGGLGGSKM
jgi:hypothetical protein